MTWPRRCLLSALTLGLAAAAPRAALAQAAPPPAQKAPQALGKSVVVVDLFEAPAQNAALESTLQSLAREHGYVPDSSANVQQAAQAAGAMQGEQVTTNPAQLGALRNALGAGVLVRVAFVSQTGGRMNATIVVTSTASTESRSVIVPMATPEARVREVVGELLKQTAPKPAAKPEPEERDPNAGWLVQKVHSGDTPVDEVDPQPEGAALRARWEDRAGLRISYGAQLGLSTMLIPDVAFSDTNPVSLNVETGSEDQYGVGGVVGARIAVMYLGMGTEPSVAAGSWAGIKLGTGVDLSFLYTRKPEGIDYKVRSDTVVSQETQWENKAQFYGAIPIQLGLLMGVGRYRTTTIWRGTVIGLSYSPALLYDLEIGQTEGEMKFNYAGVEANLDIANIEATPSGRSESQIRLFAYFLPRVEDDLPWLLHLGMGSVWY